MSQKARKPSTRVLGLGMADESPHRVLFLSLYVFTACAGLQGKGFS